MDKFFLKAKHWQLFLLMIGIPIVFEVVMVYAMLVTHDPRILFVCIPLMIVLESAILFGWYYSIGVNLCKKLPGGFTMKVQRFKFFSIFQFAYVSLMVTFIFTYFSTIDLDYRPDPFKVAAFVAAILPFHFFSMFCIFYGFWFISKTLKTIEMKKEIKFEDYAGEFFLLWFFIIGVWILQPRINKLFDETLNESETLDGNLLNG